MDFTSNILPIQSDTLNDVCVSVTRLQQATLTDFNDLCTSVIRLNDECVRVRVSLACQAVSVPPLETHSSPKYTDITFAFSYL